MKNLATVKITTEELYKGFMKYRVANNFGPITAKQLKDSFKEKVNKLLASEDYEDIITFIAENASKYRRDFITFIHGLNGKVMTEMSLGLLSIKGASNVIN